jgi:hypothetical protein
MDIFIDSDENKSVVPYNNNFLIYLLLFVNITYLNTITNMTATNTAKIAFEPLKKIALSFSGGGFRATAFCLGNLSYLHHRTINIAEDTHETLLNRVSFISSASGGSFPNLAFAYYLYSDKPFEECYKALVSFMEGTTLIDDVFKTLNDDKIWKKYPEKGRNLINAFSIAYDDTLFKGATMSLLNNPMVIKSLAEICVNATEFDNGISFRFQNSDGITRNGKVGNSKLFLNTNFLHIIGKIRLADMVAASSCFPAGFEPMIFPDDFTHPQLTAKELASTIYTSKHAQQIQALPDPAYPPEVIQPTPFTVKDIDSKGCKTPLLTFALMDGGIDDNQGIQSMMLADTRSNTDNKFDTLIVCDVSGSSMEPYVPAKENKQGLFGKYSLTFWGRFYGIFWSLIIALGLLNAQTWTLFGLDWQTILITTGSIFLLIGIAIFGYVYTIYKKLLANDWGKIIHKYIGYFFNIRSSILQQMIMARAESMVKMTTDIFLKQIRRMGYNLFYAQKAWKNRRVSVRIYELSTQEYPNTEARMKTKLPKLFGQIPHPSDKILGMAQQASEMGTTLWFDESDQARHQRENIIATGQFTMCFNLLVYLSEIEETIPTALTPALKTLQVQLLNDWHEFNKNPNWLQLS